MSESLFSFLDRVVGDGIAAAQRDYAKPRDERKLAGSVAGFEACRNRSPEQLSALLNEAHLDTRRAFNEAHASDDRKVADYWYWRCRELEIEWVCNCVSAILMNEGLPVIVPPTYRGVMKAAEIVGVGARA